MTWSELYRPARLIALALLLVAGLGVGALGKARPAEAFGDPRPDLQISMTGQTDSYYPRVWTQTITVSNPGTEGEWDRQARRVIEYPVGGPASGVVVRFSAPVQAYIEASSGTSGFTCALADGGVNCSGGRIARGGTATITIRFNYHGGCPVWSWSSFATVDPANAIAERDEANNAAQFTHWFC